MLALSGEGRRGVVVRTVEVSQTGTGRRVASEGGERGGDRAEERANGASGSVAWSRGDGSGVRSPTGRGESSGIRNNSTRGAELLSGERRPGGGLGFGLCVGGLTETRRRGLQCVQRFSTWRAPKI